MKLKNTSSLIKYIFWRLKIIKLTPTKVLDLFELRERYKDILTDYDIKYWDIGKSKNPFPDFSKYIHPSQEMLNLRQDKWQ